MLRIVLILLIVLSLSGWAMACDMSVSDRRDTLPTYVADAHKCLETPPGNFRYDTAIELAFFTKINAARRVEGLPALAFRPDLLPSARFHSLDMGVNDFFAHESLDGRNVVDRVTALDRTLLAQSVAENVAYSSAPVCTDQFERVVSCFEVPGFELPSPAFVASDLHQRLMDSPGHRANILGEDYTHMAIGVARTDGDYFVTQVFTTQAGELSHPFPVAIGPDQLIEIAPQLEDWDYQRPLARAGDDSLTDLKNKTVGRLGPAAHNLVVVGERKVTEQSNNKTTFITFTINLEGPSFVVSEAKGS